MNSLPRTIALALVIILSYRCATVTNPDGGPKDEIPPKLVSSSPANNEVNFNANKIELTFTEPIKLVNPKQQIIIIPPVGKKTQFIARKNKLEITPENPWEQNTTYAIKFRTAVQDLNEGNPVQNLNLAFSTGTHIDSLTISGTITEALSETIPEAITVAVFSTDTFNIFKHTPAYFTESDKTGKFTLTNLKSGTYRIYGFQDKNKNLIVESKSEKFAFRSNPIQLNSNQTGINLKLVNIDSRPLQLTSVRNQADLNTIRLNKPITNYKLTTSNKITNHFGTDQSEIIAYYPQLEPDSTKIHLFATDSLQQKIDTTIFIRKDNSERIKQSFSVNISSLDYLQEPNILTIQLKYNKPIRSINPDSIIVQQDSLSKPFLRKSNFKIDTIHQKITITDTLQLDLKQKKKPTLYFGKGYITSIDQDSTKREKKNLSPKTIESTGTLIVQIQTKEKHYITQVLNSGNTVIAQTTNQPISTFKYLNPENVKVRLIIDQNQNGIWDTANYINNTEPEPVIYYINTDKSYTTPIRANWEVGPLVIRF